MEIIQTELRLKDIEWVEKAMDNLKKTTRSLGSTSLADKAKKEELVRVQLSVYLLGHNSQPASSLWRRFTRSLPLTIKMSAKPTGQTKRSVGNFSPCER